MDAEEERGGGSRGSGPLGAGASLPEELSRRLNEPVRHDGPSARALQRARAEAASLCSRAARIAGHEGVPPSDGPHVVGRTQVATVEMPSTSGRVYYRLLCEVSARRAGDPGPHARALRRAWR